MKKRQLRLRPSLITLNLNQLELHWKTNTLINSKMTYRICYITSNLRVLVQNSKVTCQKISNAWMKTYLFLLIKWTTYISLLRTIITSYWQTTSQNHTKKANISAINNINKEAKCIAERLHLNDRIEQFNQCESFVTLKDHKENFQNSVRCRLLNPAKSEIGIISKCYIERINSYIRKTTNMNQWKNMQAVHLNETHLVMVRGLTHQEISIKVCQQKELVVQQGLTNLLYVNAKDLIQSWRI